MNSQRDPQNDNTGPTPNSHVHSPDNVNRRHHQQVGTPESNTTEEDDVYFLVPRTVTFVYGPYSQEGIMDYRTERLQGLKTRMEKHGTTVVMKPCLDNVNLVRIWFLDQLIFSCQITQLAHGGDGEMDPLCLEAVEALEQFLKVVLHGLRKSQHPGTTELKRPFCPCFHAGENTSSCEASGCCDAAKH